MINTIIDFRKGRLVLILSLLFSFNYSYAQSFIYENYDIEDGLPSTIIYDIYQDINGYMWFATENGISKYDGYSFNNFEGNELLNGSIILDIFPQENNTFWFWLANKKVLFFYDPHSEKFQEYMFNDIVNSQLSTNAVIESIYLDKNDNLHIGAKFNFEELIISSVGEIINNFEPYTDQPQWTVAQKINDYNTHFFISKQSDYSNEKYNSIFGKNHALKTIRFQGTSFFIYNGKLVDDNFIEILPKEISTYKIIGIKVIDEDSYAVTTRNNGAFILNNKHEIIYSFLPNIAVSNVFKDDFDGIWISTIEQGLYYIQNPTIRTIDFPLNEKVQIKNLVGNQERMYALLENGNLYELSEENKLTFSDILGLDALISYDSKNAKFHIYNSNGNITIDDTTSISFGFIKKYTEEFIDGNAFHITRNFINFKDERAIDTLEQRVQDLCIVGDTIFYAVQNGLFIKTNHKISKLENHYFCYDYCVNDLDKTDNESIFCMATQGKGLLIRRNGTYSNIRKKDGLFSNNITEVVIENDSTIWTCSTKGANRIQFKADNHFEISGWNIEEGLKSNEVKDIFFYKNNVWIGTKKGLHYISKNDLDKPMKRNAYLKLIDIHINDKKRSIEEVSKLSSKENKIQFYFEDLSFSKYPLFYKYRLKGASDTWEYTTDRSVTFQSLLPGNYSFELQSCLKQNKCSTEVISYNFLICKAFYNTRWFQLSVIALFILLTYFFFKIKVFSYNKDIIRELIRVIVKKLKRNENYLSFKENGKEIKIKSDEILYVAASGNYLDIVTTKKQFTIRHKIGDFIKNTPDPLEYVRIHRSYIVRIDQINTKAKTFVVISEIKLPVSKSYQPELLKIQF